MGNAFVDGFKEGMSQAEEAHEQGTTNISAGILRSEEHTSELQSL